MEILLAILFLPLAIYLLPALVPIWRPFLIVWAIAGAVIAAFWADAVLNPYVRSGPQDWGGSFAALLRQLVTLCWLLAGLVQGIRGIARAKGHAGYRHWPTVLLGGLVACFIGFVILD